GIQQFVIAGADGNALFNLPIEAVEFREHDRALMRVHATADADAAMDIALALAVNADFTASLCERVVAGEDRAAVAVTAERLGRQEARACDRGEVAALLTVVVGAEALRRVFDYRDVARDGVQFVHVADLPVQADRD